ncbi:hypothetical protein LBMAG57_35950 [Verrucomicrobiota bacterium]|nr:hypothetical protein LBMAG57_35950 [Verrucomicrobiota bacterium]
MPSIPHSGEGEAGGAAHAASRGAARGEGGESMPDAETSPIPPDEPPAETSIEG